MTKSNSGRFVRAAWSLLFFQTVASAGAVAVTGWAYFYVAENAGPRQAEGMMTVPEATEAMPEAAPAAPPEAAPADSAPASSEPPPSPPPPPPPPVVQ